MTKVLITGGAGFIGHHLVDYLLENTDWWLTLIDRLDGSGNLNRLMELPSMDWKRHKHRVRFVFHDLRAAINGQVAHKIGNTDYVLHLGAATHVDRSIDDPMSFVQDNVVATCNLLSFMRECNPKRFIYFGTDEVFGPAPEDVRYREDDRYRSGNPYAATKAGAEELCIAFENTYKLPISVIHCMNVFGERQHPEKFIPMVISKVLKGDKVYIHADATKTKPGSRFYIHASNVSNALVRLLDCAKAGEKYNIVGEREVNNLELAQTIAKCVGKTLNYELVDFHSSRPGHDLRYALDGTKMAKLGWTPPETFEQGIERVVKWTLVHKEWLESGLKRQAICE